MVNFYIKKRKKRDFFFKNFLKFSRGDIVSIHYRLKGLSYSFIGLCIAINKKNMFDISSTFILRNIFAKISVEFYASIYNLCRVNFKLLDHLRKKFNYKQSKLYYLRSKINAESLIKIY